MYDIRADLEELQWQSRDRVREHQRGKLIDLLRHAAEKVEWYGNQGLPAAGTEKELLKAFRELPLLTKQDLQDRGDELAASEFSGRTMEKTTGGSTGEPVTVRKNALAVAHERAASWLAYGWFGVRIGDRGMRFWGFPNRGLVRLRHRLAALVTNCARLSAFDFTDDDLEAYWRRCLDEQPDYFYGYVSMLTEFARYLQKNDYEGSRLGLKNVVTTAEVLTAPDRALLENTFGSSVQNEYGCGEVGPIAYECPAGGLHITADNVYVEVLDEEGQPVPAGGTGDVVVTDLNNRAMPLIRYRIGDRATVGENCECGRGFPTLETIHGREYDFVQDLSGGRYHGEYFLYILEDLIRRGAAIKKMRVVQMDRSTIIVRLQVDAPLTEEHRKLVRRQVTNDMPGIDVRIEEVERIPERDSGKRRIIDNQWARRGQQRQAGDRQ